jgi:hypothetical protein
MFRINELIVDVFDIQIIWKWIKFDQAIFAYMFQFNMTSRVVVFDMNNLYDKWIIYNCFPENQIMNYESFDFLKQTICLQLDFPRVTFAISYNRIGQYWIERKPFKKHSSLLQCINACSCWVIKSSYIDDRNYDYWVCLKRNIGNMFCP